jgi:hypothetical protein
MLGADSDAFLADIYPPAGLTTTTTVYGCAGPLVAEVFYHPDIFEQAGCTRITRADLGRVRPAAQTIYDETGVYGRVAPG